MWTTPRKGKCEWKSMLTKVHSGKVNSCRWMLIRFRKNRVGFTFPLPLFVFEDLLDSLGDLFFLGEKMLRGTDRFKPGVVIQLVRQVFAEIASYGCWKMVDIEVDRIRVSIEFY